MKFNFSGYSTGHVLFRFSRSKQSHTVIVKLIIYLSSFRDRRNLTLITTKFDPALGDDFGEIWHFSPVFDDKVRRRKSWVGKDIQWGWWQKELIIAQTFPLHPAVFMILSDSSIIRLTFL